MLEGAGLLGSGSVAMAAQQQGEWRWYAGTSGGDRYSPLDQINAKNVSKLHIAWVAPAEPPEVLQGKQPDTGGNFEFTPLMVDGLLYMRSEAGPVVAMNPTTGKVVWVDKQARGRGRSRGVAYWTDGKDARIFALDGFELVALNARTGARYPNFR